MLIRVKYILKKPLSYLIARIWQEILMKIERYKLPYRVKSLSFNNLCETFGYNSVDNWWNSIAERSYPFNLSVIDSSQFINSDVSRILSQANKACNHEINFLGTGKTNLGKEIDWHQDFKCGFRWEIGYYKDLKYGIKDTFSDVKIPWELSRLQWLIPIGQAYLLTNDKKYASKVREILESWIDKNPCGYSINWSCTMEVALRIITLTWLFHVFKNSSEWKFKIFRGKLLQLIYLHGDFTSRNLERSDINGNHFTANAAGLVFAGLFFGNYKKSKSWLDLGWQILCKEIILQISEDGVDFEGSIAYHRLVTELFLYPALYMENSNLPIPSLYRTQLLKMGRFISSYSRQDGSVPLVGDADDARVLPFGKQDINDHRYLIVCIGVLLKDKELLNNNLVSLTEVFWLFDGFSKNSFSNKKNVKQISESKCFDKGGYIVLRNESDHFFINANKLGLGGRGGHSHNDLLSFEGVIFNEKLITDCGAYLYTSNYDERNNFRSTSYHNTPRVNKNEINRFVGKDFLWLLHNDALPTVEKFYTSKKFDTVTVSHTGYKRLNPSIIIKRKFILNHKSHSFSFEDTFNGKGLYLIETPLHLDSDVNILDYDKSSILISKNSKKFIITWKNQSAWNLEVTTSRVSPTYGITYPNSRLIWSRNGTLMPLKITIKPYYNHLN